MARDLARTPDKDREFTVEVKSPNQCRRVLSFKIPKEELEAEKAQVMVELRRELKIPGFRKGKVPAKYVEKNYSEAIHNDAVRGLLPQIYDQALVREGITPVGEPKFDKVKAEEGHDITMEVTVEVRPEVEIEGYQRLKVKVARKEIDEGRVDETIEHLRERMMTLRVVDREVRSGDVVLIDYAPLLEEGVINLKAMTRNYAVDLGGENLLEEFREMLPGMSVGEEKDIRVKYPDGFPEKEMAGTEKVFRTTVKEIKVKELPALDDEFARGMGEQFKDLASLRSQIREDLVKEEEKRYLHEVEEVIVGRLIDINSFEVPEVMVQNYLSSILQEDRQRRPQVPDEAQRESEIREHFQQAAVRSIKKYFILEAVKKQEKLELSAEETDAKIEELARGGTGNAEEVRQYFAHPERRRSLENDLLDRKILSFLREAAEVKAA